jgi:hypothetical protein
MSDPISKGGPRPPSGITPQNETTSISEAKSSKIPAEPEKSTPRETKASEELASSKKLDLQYQSLSQNFQKDLPKKEIANQSVPLPRTTDLDTLPTKGNIDPGNILNQKTNVGSPACTETIATTCGVPDTGDELCYTVSCGSKTDL